MTTQQATYPELFSSLKLHGVTLRNRIVHASMTTKMGVKQQVTESLLNYHRNRAVGGTGMIVTEPLAIQPWHHDAYKINVFGSKSSEGLSRWAETVEGNDCRLLGQLQDSGRGRHETGKHPYAIGPSVQPDDLSWVVPRALTGGEIRALIDRFTQASERLQQAGFSGVEISAAHGHLFHQFLSPWSNLREDEWGGALANRTRIVRLLVEQIRDRCGSSFVIGLKLPGDDGLVNSIDVVEAARITKALAIPECVSYFCHAQGSHSLWLDMHLPDMHGPRVPFLELVKKIKPSAGEIPTMALGLITDPAEAQRIVASGDSELVGLGRPLVTDPAWPKKALNNRVTDIRYCVSCNTCWATIIRDGLPIACDNNPRVGLADEADWWPTASSTVRRILVIGGGVAGLETAWIAAARGHTVTLLSRGANLGGKAWLQAQLPGGENISSVYDYQTQAAQRATLSICENTSATVEHIASLNPDKIVLATGSTMLWPREWPVTLKEEGYVQDLRQVMTQMLRYQTVQGGAVIIFDQDHTLGTYMAAEFLKKLFDRVILVTSRETVAQQEALVTRQGIYRRLNECGIEIVPFSTLGSVSQLEDGVVMLRNIYTSNETPVKDIALLTYSTPREPNNQMGNELRDLGYDVFEVGDCAAPGSLREATALGHTVGMQL